MVDYNTIKKLIIRHNQSKRLIREQIRIYKSRQARRMKELNNKCLTYLYMILKLNDDTVTEKIFEDYKETVLLLSKVENDSIKFRYR